MTKTKYYIGKMMAIPVLPIMYLQSRWIKYRVPKLPEAKDLQGIVGSYDEGNENNESGIKLLTIGESSIAGVGVESHHQSIVGFLSRYLSQKTQTPVQWEVLAKSGYTAKIVNDKLIPLLKDDAPDLIVIGLGANDAFQTNTPKNWVADIKALIQNIRNKYPNPPIVFINMPPIKDFPVMSSLLQFFLGNLASIFGNELEKIVKHFDNVWYNAHQITLKEFDNISGNQYQVNDFFSDGVHPSELTYQIWGELMGEWILERVPIRK